MKRPLIPFFLSSFLFYLSHIWIFKILCILIGFLLTKKKHQMFYIVWIALIIIRGVFLWNTSYKGLEFEDHVEVHQRGFQNYLVINDDKILVDSEMLLVPGLYSLDSSSYKFTRNNPNVFNYYRYLRSKGYVDLVSADTLSLIEAHETLAFKIYRYIQNRLDSIYGSYSGILKTMIIADKSSLGETDSFKINGTLHVLAISGLHIGLLYLVLKRTTAWIPVPYIGFYILAIYVLMIGYPISAIRALLMLILSEIATKLRRPYDMISALMLVAMLMLLINPYSIYDMGLHYSFAAIVVIGNFYKFFKDLKMDGVILPLVIQFAMMPLTIYYSHQIHLLSFLLNILIIPLVSLILNIGLFTIVFPIKILSSFNAFLCDILMTLNTVFSKFDQMIVELPSPPLNLLMAYFILLICIYEKRYLKIIKKASLFLVIAYCVYKFSVVEIFFFDVGQGDGIMIKDGFKTYLIDGGKPTKDLYYRNLLLSNGVDRVRYAFLSHSDSDHIGGLIDSKDLIVSLVYQSPNDSNDNFKALSNLDQLEMSSIDAMSLGKIRIEKIDYTLKEGNNASLVFYMEVYGKTILFTGDIEACIEEEILGQLKFVDIMKVPHHGSSSSSTEAFLARTKPKEAIVSVGLNAYGHPNPQVIERYKDYGNVYTTLDGCIKVIMTPFGYIIQPYDVSSLD